MFGQAYENDSTTGSDQGRWGMERGVNGDQIYLSLWDNKHKRKLSLSGSWSWLLLGLLTLLLLLGA